jgi:pyrroline-5-carboxylate reductase
MGQAILSGLLKSGFDPGKVTVSTKSDANASMHLDTYGVTAFALENGDDANQMAVAGADVVIVAVKPGYVIEVLKEVADNLDDNALVISVAAGIRTESMQAVLPEDVAVISAMPNTPSLVGLGMTGIAKGSRANDEQLALAVDLFTTVGKTIVVDESQINAVSSISGSGPAYVFYLMEQLIAAAEHQGFNSADAAMLVSQTFLGSSQLLAHLNEPAQVLRKQVTSPNGTTERAIARMMQTDLAAMFIEATDAAVARSKELGNLKP